MFEVITFTITVLTRRAPGCGTRVNTYTVTRTLSVLLIPCRALGEGITRQSLPAN